MTIELEPRDAQRADPPESGQVIALDDPCRRGTTAVQAWSRSESVEQSGRYRVGAAAASYAAAIHDPDHRTYPGDLLVTCGLSTCSGRPSVRALIERASCPVLVIQDARPLFADYRWPVVVVATPRDPITPMFDAAFREAEHRRSSVVVVYLWEPPADEPALFAETQQQKVLDSWLSHWRDHHPGVAVTAEVVSGRTVPHLDDYVRQAAVLVAAAGNSKVIQKLHTIVPAVLFIPSVQPEPVTHRHSTAPPAATPPRPS